MNELTLIEIVILFLDWLIRRAFGPGRVRSRARTPYLLFWLTPLSPQWTLGVQIGPVNQSYSLLTATLKITKTITGALPNRPDEITIMSWNPPCNLMKITVFTSIVMPNGLRK